MFLTGALKVWNNESMKEFLQRAYRLVTDNAKDDDHHKTIIHACLAHVLVVNNVTYRNGKCILFNLGLSKNNQQIH